MSSEEIFVHPPQAHWEDFVALYKERGGNFQIILKQGEAGFSPDNEGTKVGYCSNIRLDAYSSGLKLVADVYLPNRSDYSDLICCPDSNQPLVFVWKKPQETQNSGHSFKEDSSY